MIEVLECESGMIEVLECEWYDRSVGWSVSVV